MGLRLAKTRGMLRRQAAAWLARLHSGRDHDVERKFERWRDSDPRHAEAFERMRRSYEQAGLLRQSPAFASGLTETAPRRPQRTLRPALAAAAAIVVLVAVGLLALRDTLPSGGTDAVMLMTSVGEIKRVALADGSNVTLDTSTRVDVEIGRSRRIAHLRYGRARFQIAQARAPFMVASPGATITTDEAVMDVAQQAQQGEVTILAGRADVRTTSEGGQSRATLAAGDGLALGPGGAAPKAVAAPASDWTSGMLLFDRTPLADAIGTANRYSARKIVAAGDLERLRVTGAFRAGDTPGLAKALAAAFRLSLEQRRDGHLVLSRQPSSAPSK